MSSPHIFLYHDDMQGLVTINNVGSTPVYVRHFDTGANSGFQAVDDSGVRVKVPGAYRVSFQMSFTMTNGFQLNAHLFINEQRKPYGAHSLGLTGIINNVSIVGLFDFNKNDTIRVGLTTDNPASDITIYDCQLVVSGV